MLTIQSGMLLNLRVTCSKPYKNGRYKATTLLIIGIAEVNENQSHSQR